MALTRRQREIYDFIRDFVAENGYSPSLEEIAAHFDLASVATVHKHVQHLVEKRLLRKAWNRSQWPLSSHCVPVRVPNCSPCPARCVVCLSDDLSQLTLQP